MFTADESLTCAPLLCTSFTYAEAFKRNVMGMSLGKHDRVLENMKLWLRAPSQVNISDFPFPIPFAFICSTIFFKLIFQIHLNFAPLFYSAFSFLSAVNFPLILFSSFA